jgi:hypothetical protein
MEGSVQQDIKPLMAEGEVKTEEPMDESSGFGPFSQVLECKYFKIVASKTAQDRNVFELISYKQDDEESKLKLFRSQMGRLCSKLPRAYQVAAGLWEGTPDQTVLIDTVSRYNKVYVRLLVDTFMGKSYIWLRLYFTDEMTGAIVPSRRAVQLSPEDNPERIVEFVRHHTRDEIQFESSRPLIIDQPPPAPPKTAAAAAAQ